MSSLYRRNGIYWRQFRENGRTYRESLKTRDRSTAIYLKAQKDKELIEGKSILPDKKALCLPVLDQYKKDFRHARAQKTNDDQYKKIKDFLDWARVLTFSQITTQQIKNYLNHCIEDKLSLYTINTIIQNLKTWLNYCVKNRYLFENQAAHIKKYRIPQKDVRFLTVDEIHRMLEVAQDEKIYCDGRPTLYPVIATGIYTGFRPKEIFTLDWENIDFAHNTIRIRNKTGFTAKDKENRSIPLHGKLKKILLPLHQKSGRCFDMTNYKRIFRRIRKEAGLLDTNWYSLRHTFASHALMAGVPIATVSKWLGHSSVTTTMIYAHLLRDHQQDEIKKLDF